MLSLPRLPISESTTLNPFLNRFPIPLTNELNPEVIEPMMPLLPLKSFEKIFEIGENKDVKLDLIESVNF